LVDPKFIDPEKGDYRVQNDSPAIQLGFENFPMDQFGVYKPEFVKELANIERAFIPSPTIQQTKNTRQDN